MLINVSSLTMNATLPLVFSGGFPKSLYELDEDQLERFLEYVWTYTNTAKHARVLPEYNSQRNRAQALRQLICALYERLGLTYLLYFSEGLAKTKGSDIYYEIDREKNDIIVWNKRSRSVIARIPASNVCYDAVSEKLERYKKKSPKKKKMGEDSYPVITKVWSEVPVVQIELPDSDTEDSSCNNKKNKVVEDDSIVISDSEEHLPLSNIKNRPNEVPRRKKIERCRRSTEKNRNCKLNGEQEIPFINSAITITKVIPDLEKNNRSALLNGSRNSLLVGDDSQIVISDSEDTEIQEIPHRKVSDRLVEEIVISDSEDAVDLENKSSFLYQLGLCEPTNLPDDPIILPIPGKGDFNKFHRLPLTTIPLLVKHSLIDKHSVEPGPPGQNSNFTSTNKRFVNENITKSNKTSRKFGRYKTLDLDNCNEYRYPKKHYRGVPCAPLPMRISHGKQPPAKAYSHAKKRSKLNLLIYINSSVEEKYLEKEVIVDTTSLAIP
ncbi:unnamed protein product [Nezara viridula]|uniref:Uncharacterized protein n=1 Tax=Nezara viridula TaxID=85310 RepID=A0A9P0H3L5_NEZVI|nr:unnamed protein product [Nezara viridula]